MKAFRATYAPMIGSMSKTRTVLVIKIAVINDCNPFWAVFIDSNGSLQMADLTHFSDCQKEEN